jgi:hypothetical protein
MSLCLNPRRGRQVRGMNRSRRPPGWPVLASALLFGCSSLPEKVVWLPDSSGFTFARPAGFTSPEREAITTVYHYDIRSKALHVVVPPEAKTGTKVPGVSPDGTRVAVAQVWTGSKGPFVQVRTYRLDGEVDLASEPFRLFNLFCLLGFGRSDRPSEGGAFEKPEFIEAAVEWSPDGRRLLVDCWVGCARYDFQTKRFRQFAPSVTIHHREALDPSILPDGSGFLATWSRPGEPYDPDVPEVVSLVKDMVLVDWDGNARRFTLAPGDEAVIRRLADEVKREFTEDLFRFRHGGGWQGQVAVLPLRRGNIVIDPSRRSITYRDDPAVARLDELARRSQAETMEELGGGAVTVAAIRDGVAVRPRRGAWKVVAPGASGVEIVPSPDRAYAAVHYLKWKDVYRMTVIDRDGEIAGEFDMTVIGRNGKIAGKFDVR